MTPHYYDCDVCGERFHGADARQYLREVEVAGEVEYRCPKHLAPTH